MVRVKIGLAVVMGAAVGVASPAAADPADQTEDAKQEVSRLWNVESMMWQAAENISRRYNLNEKQREITHQMLTEEVTRFLEEHDNIWPLIRDLARHQMSGRNPEGDVARRIGQTAVPLMREVREAILSGNERWRKILTDEQKRMHDWDLRDMEKTFAKMEANFSAMTEGVPVKQGLFPAPNADEPQPTRPPRPPRKHRPVAPRPVDRQHPQEEWWDSYVQEFIRRFELDEAQSEAARSILRECKSRARTYRKSKEKEFDQARQRLNQARRPGQAPEVQKAKIRVWTQIEKGLNKPIVDLFQELKDRLDRIPTDAQKERERRTAGRSSKPTRSQTTARLRSKAPKATTPEPERKTDDDKSAPPASAEQPKPKAAPAPTPSPTPAPTEGGER